MKKGSILFICLVLTIKYSYGQNISSIWYFGSNAGLNFNHNPPKSIDGGQTDAAEGTSVICDDFGNLLFYSDGITVWNKNHDTMVNGTGLFGRPSSNQACLIIPQPGNDSIYYIITTGASIRGPTTTYFGAYYHTVNINLENGYGVVTSKNIKLIDESSERVAATANATGTGYWIALTQYNAGKLFVYHLDNTGLSAPKTVTLPAGKTDFGRGQMKFSPKGRFLAFSMDGAFVKSQRFICLYQFDNHTGELTEPKFINEIKSYGLEFSPNEQYLYAASEADHGAHHSIYQFSVDSILDKSIETTTKTLIHRGSYRFSSFQLAPNGSIYIAGGSPNRKDLAKITYPNNSGLAVDYTLLPSILNHGTRNAGLPSLVSSSIYSPKIHSTALCFGDSTIVSVNGRNIDSIQWSVKSNTFTTTDTLITWVFSDSGGNAIRAIVHEKNYSYTLYDTIEIQRLPKLDLGNDSLICSGESVLLSINDSEIDSIVWYDNSNVESKKVEQPSLVWVKVRRRNCWAYDTVVLDFMDCDFRDTFRCFGDTIIFSLEEQNIDSVVWSFGDGQTKTTNEPRVKHVYHKPDDFTVTANVYKRNLSKVLVYKIEIITPIDLNLGEDITTCLPIRLTTDLDTTSFAHSWSNGSSGNSTWINSSGSYSVEVLYKQCTAADTITIEEQYCECDIYVPNAISPNGDGYNDYFGITVKCDLTDYSLEIFNRWGEIVFRSQDPKARFILGPDLAALNIVFGYKLTYRTDESELHMKSGTIHVVK